MLLQCKLITYKLISCALLTLIFLGCSNSKNKGHPMVDGKKLEYKKLGIEPILIAENVHLYLFQNESYVWISYDFPKGSFGTLDMILESPKLESPINIHVSAQLGEWPINDPKKQPSSPTSNLWWDIKGWTANTLWVNGIDTISYNTPELKFKNGEIRELQLSKDRFGKGEWKLKLKINAIKDIDGDFFNFEYPNDESLLKINVT